MKKLFALSLTLVCLGLFAIGCEPAKKPEAAPQPPVVEAEKTADPVAEAPKAEEEKPADAAPAPEEKKAE